MQLRPYQCAGVDWLKTRRFGILADTMGMGKTPQYIRAAEETGAPTVVIVAPLATIPGIVPEIGRWTEGRAIFTVLDHKGKVPCPTTGWIIVPWTSVAKRLPSMLQALRRIDVLILDEAHKAKNPGAAMTKAVLGQWRKGEGSWTRTPSLAGIATAIWAVTGTAMPNRPIELQPLLHMAGGYPWAAHARYGDAYCRRVNKFCPRGYDYLGARNLPDLRAKLKAEGCVLRRTPEDVPEELPDLVTQIVGFAGVRDCSAMMGLDGARILAAVERGESVPFTELSAYRREMGWAKIDPVASWVADWCEGNEGQALVLWCWHVDLAQGIATALCAAGLDVLVATGADDAVERQATVDKFAGGIGQVFVATIGACGLGLNGLQRRTTACAFAELAWTPGELTQAIHRTRRIGSCNGLAIAYLLCGEDSLEHRIYSIVAGKLVVGEAVGL